MELSAARQLQLENAAAYARAHAIHSALVQLGEYVDAMAPTRDCVSVKLSNCGDGIDRIYINGDYKSTEGIAFNSNELQKYASAVYEIEYHEAMCSALQDDNDLSWQKVFPAEPRFRVVVIYVPKSQCKKLRHDAREQLKALSSDRRACASAVF